MTSPTQTGLSAIDPVWWSEVDAWTWRAMSGAALIGTVTLESQYVLRLADGDLAGVHTSLESAKSQMDAWVRWQFRAPLP